MSDLPGESMVRRRAAVMPFLVLGTAVLLGGWFLQEGVEREENLYIQVRVFQEVVERVADEFVEEVDRESLYESAIEGLLDRLDDPNTSFISARAYEEFEIRTTSGEYGGVGLEVVERDGHVTVVAPVPGTPGARSGIRPGDWFVEIEGENAEGWPVDRAVQVLRGEPGSSVQVKMGRAGVDEPIPFTLSREVIHLRSVPFSLVLEGGVGYVPLQIFRTTSSDEVRVALDSLVAEGIESVILDLRGNPGGLLEEGIGVAELFLGRGAAIAETRGRGRGQSRAFQASVDAAYPDLPLLVLVDGSSASASEIVAGALQDHDRGAVVGLPTYGKGSVQTLFRLSGGNVLRLTTARWYTPVGRHRARTGGAVVAG
jgi:carboxyl-terminal processing protease